MSRTSTTIISFIQVIVSHYIWYFLYRSNNLFLCNLCFNY